MRRSLLLLSLGLAAALSEDTEIVPAGSLEARGGGGGGGGVTAATLPEFEFPNAPPRGVPAQAEAETRDTASSSSVSSSSVSSSSSSSSSSSAAAAAAFDDSVSGEEDDAVREAGAVDAATTRRAGVVLDALDVPSFQDAERAGAALPRASDETRGFDVTLLASYDHQVDRNRQVLAAGASIDRDMKARLEKTSRMLLPLRRSLAELAERERFLQKRLQRLKLEAKRKKIEGMKRQLQKDEAEHEVQEAALARQKAEHDKHLAEIAKHLSVLNAEEQGAMPEDEDEDEDEDEGEGEGEGEDEGRMRKRRRRHAPQDSVLDGSGGHPRYGVRRPGELEY